ncbi:ABC transporter permease [Streptomyces sp. MUM 203J]|uniref:ABC transporter permease n=1 Tax=Streptomyces sp. MUM 203J TaxID=2791990 RepID=UPI001F04D8FD|nr:ABC transporter permease [Streptomyces sp. MUM 203J]MCH0538543.1 ABC transporter permease [Streptomyces sp. MUM 203J]
MSALKPSGPGRVAIRQHRRSLWVAGCLVAAAVAVVAGLSVWRAALRDEGACAAEDWLHCEQRIFGGQGSVSGLLGVFLEGSAHWLLFLPALIGAFVAGPLIARELESGTHQLAWTQSVSPRRWLAAKAGGAAVVAALIAAVLTGTFMSGYASVHDRVLLRWPDRGLYESSGPVLAAYCLLGVAVGALVGLLVRRTVAAMAVAGPVTAAVLLVFGSFRWDVWPHETLSGTGTDREHGMSGLPFDTFLLRSGYTTESGERLAYDACWSPDTGHDVCPPELGITGWFAEYHPSSAFWPVQFTETALVLALTALAALAAFRALRQQHA